MKRLSLVLTVLLFCSYGIILCGKDTAAKATSKEENTLSDKVKLIIGEGKTRNYYLRVRAIHSLNNRLSQSDIEALYQFLYKKLNTQKLPNLQFNALKNEIVMKLMRQKKKPAALADHLVKMYYDKSFDLTWRDYCVQFFGKWYENAPSDKDREIMKQGLIDALQERNSSIAGTSLTMMRHLVHFKDFDKATVSEMAYEVITQPDCSSSGKSSGLQVCATLGNKKALQLARIWAEKDKNVFVKMSAMATIGMLGDKSDLELLEKYGNSRDIRLRGPAKAAVIKINKRCK